MMQALPPHQVRSEQVYQTLLDAICDGSLAPGTHVVQEQIAAKLGVSRQPVQQALAILKTEGLLLELGKRGLFVAPLDLASMRHHYEIRAALDRLAARKAAERAANKDIRADIEREGRASLAAGRAAMAGGRIADMVNADIAFHSFLYQASGNPLLASSAAPHWRQLRRVMGEVLRRAETPDEIWRQHAGILSAVLSADAELAEQRSVNHVDSARQRLEKALAPVQK
ncbi:MAG: GntR family transcriptional regulator [Methylocystis sp.]|jgi:DNA-binding GntR family transcriptional regulator|nr:GntR family transcriptional regulator [Methylocystis sp.]MCA3587679.1 GntR family transcriptional regulator [Methylocystis sp.]MCA3592972.1 GntR family transcriptional regulator [Methylocystis sp.]